jgi:hypothetical protein
MRLNAILKAMQGDQERSGPALRDQRGEGSLVAGLFEDSRSPWVYAGALCVLSVVLCLACSTGLIASDDLWLWYSRYAQLLPQHSYVPELIHFAIRYGLIVPLAGVALSTCCLRPGLILVINVVCVVRRQCYVWQADCVRSDDNIGPVRIGGARKMRRKNSHCGLPPALWILYEVHGAYVLPPRLLGNKAKCRHLVCARSPAGLGKPARETYRCH